MLGAGWVTAPGSKQEVPIKKAWAHTTEPMHPRDMPEWE